jgi:hypothetical protein
MNDVIVIVVGAAAIAGLVFILAMILLAGIEVFHR